MLALGRWPMHKDKLKLKNLNYKFKGKKIKKIKRITQGFNGK
jgi:hypothetical protein